MIRRISRHAVVFGALGQGNRGDDALLAAIVEWMNDRYDALTVMLLAQDVKLIEEIQRLTATPISGESLPPMYSRKRPWSGRRLRSACRSRIVNRLRGATIDAFWIGGLLGPIWQHNRIRCLELKWAAEFAHTLTWFFGDVADSFADTPYARRWVRLADSLGMHVAVRSREAAEQLRAAGLRSSLAYGLDPALFTRCFQRGLPFPRLQASEGVIALNPSAIGSDEREYVWLGLAEAADDRNLSIRWISTCDAVDLDFCQRLAGQIAERRPDLHQEMICGCDAERSFAPARYAVTSRYHGTIFALAAGVPTMVCPSAAKVERLAKLLRIDQFAFSPTNSSDDVRVRASDLMNEIDSGRWRPAYDVLTDAVRQHEATVAAIDARLFVDADSAASETRRRTTG